MTIHSRASVAPAQCLAFDQELPGTQTNRTKSVFKKGNRNRPSDDFKITTSNRFKKRDSKTQNLIRDWGKKKSI